ncbi:MAG: hypothetical protein WAX67_01025 [Rugosibacter sp.]
MIISDPKARRERAEQKRTALLRFLREELYTTPGMAGLVMGCGERAARQTIASMESEGVIKRHPVALAEGQRPVMIIGITGHGQGIAFGEGETVRAREFRLCDFSMLHLQHTTDIQRLRVASSDITGKWVPGGLLPKSKKGVKRPDAIAVLHDGARVAIEVERSIKNPMRYREILAGHLLAIKQKNWDRVVWTSPSKEISGRVERIIKSINRLKIGGIDTLLTPSDFAHLSFCEYKRFRETLVGEVGEDGNA